MDRGVGEKRPAYSKQKETFGRIQEGVDEGGPGGFPAGERPAQPRSRGEEVSEACGLTDQTSCT